MKNIWKKFKLIIIAIISFIPTVITFIFFNKKENNKKNTEERKEEIKHEIENKSPDDIAANSPNQELIQSNIQREQEEFRKRIRDRLNQKL